MEGVLSRVQRAFNDAFQIDPDRITLDTTPGDVDGWDSMGHLTLVNNLEGEFHISFDVDELMAMENVKEIVKIIETKVGAKVT
jgi:acyl carrier protein